MDIVISVVLVNAVALLGITYIVHDIRKRARKEAARKIAKKEAKRLHKERAVRFAELLKAEFERVGIRFIYQSVYGLGAFPSVEGKTDTGRSGGFMVLTPDEYGRFKFVVHNSLLEGDGDDSHRVKTGVTNLFDELVCLSVGWCDLSPLSLSRFDEMGPSARGECVATIVKDLTSYEETWHRAEQFRQSLERELDLRLLAERRYSAMIRLLKRELGLVSDSAV